MISSENRYTLFRIMRQEIGVSKARKPGSGRAFFGA